MREICLLALNPFQSTGNLNDLHVLNTDSGVWREISFVTSGIVPEQRHSFGFVAAEGKIYVFGGSCNVNSVSAIVNSRTDPLNVQGSNFWADNYPYSPK